MSKAAGDRVRVLLVEDNAAEARLLKETLADTEWTELELLHVENLGDALLRLESEHCDAVLLDLSLPDGQGLDTFQRIHEKAPTTPVVVLTGLDDEMVAVRALNRGAQDYLVKGSADGSLMVRSIRYAIERAKLWRLLSASEERYALAARGANDGLWDWDLAEDEIYYPHRWKAMLGYAEGEISNSPEEWFNRVHPEDIARLKDDISSHVDGYTSHLENEHRILHKDGKYRWMLSRGIAIRDPQGEACRMAGSQTDISDRKQAEQRLMHDAFHDALTGLANRALFLDRLGRAIERAKRRKDYIFAVLFVDLDRFKGVNDGLGHFAGDQMLSEVARALEACVRAEDTVARLGGDEFAILLDEIADPKDAVQVVERIQSELTLPFTLEGHEVFISASTGIALSTGGYDRAVDVLRDADTAMYRAKALGKARYQVFDEPMQQKAIAVWKLETDLRRALERNEFQTYYQPIIAVESLEIIGFEALLRWQHPHHGMLLPAEFIPIAEETGLILPIGKWVLLEACRQLREWQEEFQTGNRFTVSVNLSSKQFTQPDLVRQVDQVLWQYGLEAQLLRLEITESVLMQNPEFATSVLVELRNLGIKLAIDDFGIGFSSLSALHCFPIDTLKIDRSFVSRLNLGSQTPEIVPTIVSLARDLGLTIVAEGVETAEQFNRLKELKCDFAQGFLFSHPVEAQQAAKLLNVAKLGTF